MGWVRVVVWFGRIVRVRVRVWVRVWMRNKGIGAANVVSRDCALASDLVRANICTGKSTTELEVF